MRKIVTMLLAVALCGTYATAQEDQSKELDRVQASQKVLHEIMAAPDKGIPNEILASADCVAIVPSMLKGGFVFGGNYGRGVATCRTTDDHWSAPAPIAIEGGSWGLQIGGQAVDLVMLVMNKNGMENLLNSKFKVGADVSAAAGPVGRQVEGTTDWKMRAEVLTYSRARGVFAGITLNGAVIKQDADGTVMLYGKNVPFRSLLTGQAAPPPGTQPFLTEVAGYFRAAKGQESAQTRPQQEATSASARGTETQAAPSTTSTGGTAATATPPEPSGSTSTAGASSVGAQTQSSSQTSTTQTQETTPSSGSVAGSSEEVRQNIDTALRNTPNVDLTNLHISVTNDTVILSGTVPNEQTWATVLRVAQEHAGGRRVESQLNIK